MSTTLYNIALEGLLISDILTENDGELTPELEARLDSLLLAGKEKIESAAMVVRQLEANANAAKVEACRLADRAKSFEAQADRLKQRITVALDAAFGGKVKTPLFTVWSQTSPPTTSFAIAEGFTLDMVREDDPDLVRTEVSLDKKKLLELRKMGESLPESIVVDEKPGTRYLRIK